MSEIEAHLAEVERKRREGFWTADGWMPAEDAPADDDDLSMWVSIDNEGRPMTETALCGIHEASRTEYARMMDERLNVHDWNGKPRQPMDGEPGLSCTVCGYVQPTTADDITCSETDN